MFVHYFAADSLGLQGTEFSTTRRSSIREEGSISGGADDQKYRSLSPDEPLHDWKASSSR